jgi:hypothetical protein
MRIRPLPLLAFGLPASCAAPPPQAVVVEATIPELECGLQGAIARRFSTPYAQMRPARACAVPTGQGIASACDAAEAVAAGPPNAMGERPYSFPGYRVRGARCRFTNAGQSQASCRFEIAGRGAAAAWRPMRASFAYRFRDLSNEIAHDYFLASWEAEGVCRAR